MSAPGVSLRAAEGGFTPPGPADLVLPPIMAGEPVGPEQLADLGLGGLLDRGMGWRFPPYDEDAAAGDEEE